MTNSSSKFLTIPMVPLNGLKKGAKPHSVKSKNKPKDNVQFGPNQLPKWKINKLKNKDKAPAPRSKGLSKSDRFTIDNFGYHQKSDGLDEPHKQGGFIDFSTTDFCNLFSH